MPHAWLQAHARNVLYIENSLIHQHSGVFADHLGFFSQSALCREQTWRDPPCYNLAWFAGHKFNWALHHPCSLSGPLLVALQPQVERGWLQAQAGQVVDGEEVFRRADQRIKQRGRKRA